MRLWRILLLVCLLVMMAGCAAQIKVGTYSLTHMYSRENVNIDDSGIAFSQYSDWKDQMELKFQMNKPDNLLYGRLIFGNDHQVFRLAITKDSDYVHQLFLDQNGDGEITAEEAYPLEPAKKARFLGTELYSYSREIPLGVSYHKADGTKITKKIYMAATFRCGASDRTSPKVVMNYRVVSYFLGEVKVTYKSQERPVKFILMDGNHNGNFNDYGKDVIIIDQNYDGKFSSRTEKQPLLELFQLHNTQKSQPDQVLRVGLFAYPEKIIVQDSNMESPEAGLLEPAEEEH